MEKNNKNIPDEMKDIIRCHKESVRVAMQFHKDVAGTIETVCAIEKESGIIIRMAMLRFMMSEMLSAFPDFVPLAERLTITKDMLIGYLSRIKVEDIHTKEE